MSRPFPPALPHGDLIEVLPGIRFVTGTVAMPGPVPVRFSRAMTVLVEGDRLVLVNSVRLDAEGLAKLDAIGRVTDVIRLAGFHGMDDPFYRDRYGAKVWAIRGQRYTAGFDSKSEPYFTADAEVDAQVELPIAGARVHVFGSRPPEGLLVLERNGGTLIAGDSLQNWAEPDPYFNLPGRLLMRMMGFIHANNVGPGWLRQAKPPAADLAAVLDIAFENVLPSHGTPVIGRAKESYRASIERAVARAGAQAL
jgi:hypothetical protein